MPLNSGRQFVYTKMTFRTSVPDLAIIMRYYYAIIMGLLCERVYYYGYYYEIIMRFQWDFWISKISLAGDFSEGTFWDYENWCITIQSD